MAVYFFDKSVLVKRYAQEIGSAWVEALMDLQADTLAAKVLSLRSAVKLLSDRVLVPPQEGLGRGNSGNLLNQQTHYHMRQQIDLSLLATYRSASPRVQACPPGW
jgi:hypothetical protein